VRLAVARGSWNPTYLAIEIDCAHARLPRDVILDATMILIADLTSACSAR